MSNIDIKLCLAALSFLALLNLCSAERCRGGFDLYFVLDKSSSVRNQNFEIQTVGFVEKIVSSFVSSKLRVSFITFSTDAELVTGLTGNRTLIQSGFQALKKVTTGGDTFMDRGLKIANDQIEKFFGEKTAGVIIALTDGKIGNRKSQTFKEAKESRSLGASVFAVGVDNYDQNELNNIADKPSQDHVFLAGSYDALENIIESIVKKSCIEVLSAQPTKACAGERFEVTLNGNGFMKTDNTSQVACNFKLGEKNQNRTSLHFVMDYQMVIRIKLMQHNVILHKEYVSKASFVSSNRLKCWCPAIPKPGSKVTIHVSVHSNKYVSSDVTIEAIDCQPRIELENETRLCVGDSSVVTVSGQHLTRDSEKSQSNVACRIVYNDTYSAPAKVVSLTSSSLQCEVPALTESERSVWFQVTTSNYEIILRSMKITVTSCAPIEKKANVGLVVGIVFALFLLFFIALWWFWLLIFPKPKEEPVSPTLSTGPPQKKWPSVDTSYYGGGGIGGITPVKVKWGDKGATDAGALLQAAEMRKKRETPSGSSEEPKPSCWDITKERLLAFFGLFPKAYAWLSSKRPQRSGSGRTGEKYSQVRLV